MEKNVLTNLDCDVDFGTTLLGRAGLSAEKLYPSAPETLSMAAGGGEFRYCAVHHVQHVGSVIAHGVIPEWLSTYVDDVNAAMRLPINWDSYGGLPLDQKAALGGLELLTNMRYYGPPAHVAPTPDGALHLEWSRPDFVLEIEVERGGEVGVLVARAGDVDEFETGLLGDARLAQLLQVLAL
jgi:hypothetical protein